MGEPLAVLSSASITFVGRLLNVVPGLPAVLAVGEEDVDVGVTLFELQLEATMATSVNTTSVHRRRNGVQNFFITCPSIISGCETTFSCQI